MRSRGAKKITKRIGRNVFDRPPKVSVVIPAFNLSEFIAETLDSVLGQRFREHEIIVVNDGSTDSRELELSMGKRIEDIIYICQPNAGAGIARNVAIEHARGEIIAFLDGDDVWLPDFLASQYIFLQRHRYDMVYCDAVMFGLRYPYRQTFMETAPSSGEATFDALLDLRCNVITSGTMARKQTILDAGMFETERVRAHDFHLWLRMAKNGAKIGYQKKQLVKYRIRLDSLSGNSVSRAVRERDAFERVRGTIPLNHREQKIVKRRLAACEADLAIEHGKSLLLRGSYREAAVAFREANRHRKSLKLTIITWLARLAPRMLLRHYRTHRAADIALVPRT
jgi:glycosyltransferase involved in cell wall biosynthesis